jgi:hypothetical protein
MALTYRMKLMVISTTLGVLILSTLVTVYGYSNGRRTRTIPLVGVDVVDDVDVDVGGDGSL